MKWSELERLIKSYAQAKANRVHLEHFRKVKLALLTRDAPEDLRSEAARESWARCQKEYGEVLDGLKEATEIEASAYWKLHMFEMRFERWRTNEATRRAEMKLV